MLSCPGVHRELEELEGVCYKLQADNSLLDAYHNELRRVEGRSSLTITSIVDVLREMSGADGRLAALETLLQTHIASQLLIRNHIAAHAAHLENLPSARSRLSHGRSSAGVASTYSSLQQCILDASHEAQMMAEHAGHEGQPLLELDGFDSDPVVACVPHHLSHIILELLKNAFKTHLDADKSSVPVVVRHRIAEIDGASCVCLDIVDSGTGVHGGTNAFQALAKLRPGTRYERTEHQTSYAAVEDPLSGLGVGLCLARLHTEHFEGNQLLLCSDGYNTGATATIILTNDADARERAPDIESALATL